jgi:hypothetical protein
MKSNGLRTWLKDFRPSQNPVTRCIILLKNFEWPIFFLKMKNTINNNKPKVINPRTMDELVNDEETFPANLG